MPLDFSTGRRPLVSMGLPGMAAVAAALALFFVLASASVSRQAFQTPPGAAPMPDTRGDVAVTLRSGGRVAVEGTATTTDSVRAVLDALRGDRTGVVIDASGRATVDDLAAVAAAARTLGLRVTISTEPAPPDTTASPALVPSDGLR